ncbi:MAG: hypothetical protein QXW79_01290 [Thermoplasmata archaeon]
MDSKQKVTALKISDIVIDDIIVSTKKTNRTVPITYNNGPLVFQTPWLEVKGKFRKTPFPNIYQFDTLFKGDAKTKICQFYQFIENLETHVSNQIITIGSKWFTQKNVVIKSLIRELENDKGIYFIKWPIDLQPFTFIDEQKKSFDPTNLQDKHLVKLIVEISNLWIDENQCGLAVFVQKVMVNSNSGKQKEYVFDESESDVGMDEKSTHIISLLATDQKINKNMDEQPPNVKESVKSIKSSGNDKSIEKSQVSNNDNLVSNFFSLDEQKIPEKTSTQNNNEPNYSKTLAVKKCSLDTSPVKLIIKQPERLNMRNNKHKRTKRKIDSPSSDELADSEKEESNDSSSD